MSLGAWDGSKLATSRYILHHMARNIIVQLCKTYNRNRWSPFYWGTILTQIVIETYFSGMSPEGIIKVTVPFSSYTYTLSWLAFPQAYETLSLVK